MVDRAAAFQSKKVREDVFIADVPVPEPVPVEPASAPVFEAVDKRLLGGQFEMGKKIGSGAFVRVWGYIQPMCVCVFDVYAYVSIFQGEIFTGMILKTCCFI